MFLSILLGLPGNLQPVLHAVGTISRSVRTNIVVIYINLSCRANLGSGSRLRLFKLRHDRRSSPTNLSRPTPVFSSFSFHSHNLAAKIPPRGKLSGFLFQKREVVSDSALDGWHWMRVINNNVAR